MKAIVVTDKAAGTAGMRLVERPEPKAKPQGRVRNNDPRNADDAGSRPPRRRRRAGGGGGGGFKGQASKPQGQSNGQARGGKPQGSGWRPSVD